MIKICVNECNSCNKNKAIVDIRLRPRCTIPSPPSRPIGCIACAEKFSEYYLRLPAILNDPVCYMTLLAIEWIARTPKIALSPWGICTPSNTWFLGPTRVFIQNGISIGSAVVCTAHRRVSYYFTMDRYVSPKSCTFRLGYRFPHLAHGNMVSRAHLSHHPKRHLDRFSRFCMGPKRYAVQCIVNGEKPKIALPLGILSPCRRRSEPRP